MACGAVDNGRIRDVFAVVDQNRPDVDEDEKDHVGELLQREDEGKDVVWYGLREAIERMERMRRVWRGHDPFMVRLVEALVDERMVEASVYPVYAQIRKADEERELDEVVPQPGP